MSDKSPVRPPRLKKIPASITRAVILPMNPLNGRETSPVPAELVRREFNAGIHRFQVLDDRVVVTPAMGAPAAAMVVETLVRSGIERILLAGSCGILVPEITAGTVIVPHQALSECGTTFHYPSNDPGFTPHPPTLNRIEHWLTSIGMAPRSATVVTTDAPFRETPRFLARVLSHGAEVVDMECAAVFASARFLGVQATAVLVTADRVTAEHWERKTGTLRYLVRMRKLLPQLWNLDF